MPSPPKHPNSFEHLESIYKFLFYFLAYGLFGALVGRIIDRFLTTLKSESKGIQFLLAIFQLFLNGLLFYIAFRLITFRFGSMTLTLDDWISSTFQGLIFATTIYSVQNNLYENLKNSLF